jgi:hypothetical protein
MNTTYQSALDGTLDSTQTGDPFAITIENQFEIPIIVTWLNLQGVREYVAEVDAKHSISVPTAYNGYYYLITSAYTGGFMCVLSVDEGGGNYPVSCADVTDTNDIGSIPQPTAAVLLPPDSPRVLVGCGKLSGGKAVIREQYWDRQPDSFCMASGETKTFSMTLVSGKQETSSTEATVSASLGLSVSGGWGPVSASISSSLSASASSFQQVTVTEQSTMYVSDTLKNSATYPVMYLRWQLVDVVTIFKKEGRVPLASILSGENPIVTQGPFNLTALPAGPENRKDRADDAENPNRRDRAES